MKTKIITDPYKQLMQLYAQGDEGKINDKGGQIKELISVTADLIVAYPDLLAHLLLLGAKRKAKGLSKMYSSVKTKKS